MHNNWKASKYAKMCETKFYTWTFFIKWIKFEACLATFKITSYLQVYKCIIPQSSKNMRQNACTYNVVRWSETCTDVTWVSHDNNERAGARGLY